MRKLFIFISLLMVMASCGDVKVLTPGDLAGLWDKGKATGPFGDMAMSILFEPNEQDSTSGEFVVFYNGTCFDSDNGVDFAIHYTVADNGTYTIDGTELTLNYLPDSVGVDIDEKEIGLHATAKANHGDNRDIEEITEEFGNQIYGYIGTTFQEHFTKLNTENANRYRTTMKNRTLSLHTIGKTDRVNLLRSDE